MGAVNGFTTIVIVLVALRLFGKPLSVTATVIVFVESAWPVSGFQVNKPVAVFSVAFVGPASSVYVSVCAGSSVTEEAIEMFDSALVVKMVPFTGAVKTGATFGLTVKFAGVLVTE